MEFTAENLEKVVTLFYRSEAVQQAQAHQWLTEAQCSPQAWSFVWELLQPHQSSEVQFFAATTLHTKVLRFWKEVPADHYDALKKQIIDAIINYAMGPKIVLNRLCITLSAYILYTIPSHWPNAIGDLLTNFQPHNLPNIQPERVIWILLEILTLIPEEFQSMTFSQSQRNVVRNELQNASNEVLKVTEMYLSSSCNNTEVNTTTHLNSARCANSWFQFGSVTIDTCEHLLVYLLDVCCNCYWTHKDDTDAISSDELEMIEATVEAYTSMITHPHTHKYPTVVMSHLDKMMNKIVKIVEVEHHKKDKNMNILIPLYNLVISSAETHVKLLIQNLLKKGMHESEVVMWIIHTILMCTSTPGQNPIDEECSTLTFGFWYLLQDETLSLDPEQSTSCVEMIKPFYRDLITVLLQKSMLPSNDDDPKWTTESKEVLRCHRQDIADTMMYSYEILSSDLLEILNIKLHEAIQMCTNNGKIVSANWPHIEACLHSYFAIAEHFENEESDHLPRLMDILQQIPYSELHAKVLSTALDIIGAYANWISEHSYMLQKVVPLLLLGLQSCDTAPSATMALKDISRECHQHIGPYAVIILDATEVVLQTGNLRISENVRLMFTLGKVLSVMPLNDVMHYLNRILTPIVKNMQDILNSEQMTPANKSSIIVRLKMISTLFSTLDSSIKEGERSTSNACPQPILVILPEIMPLFVQIVEKLCQDAEVMEFLSAALKHAVTTLMDDCKPVVNDILRLLVTSYRVKPLASALDVFKQLMLMFGNDSDYAQTMHQLLCEIVDITLNTCTNANQHLSELDMLEAFYSFLTQLLKKNFGLIISEGINISGLFQCAILCLGLPELPIVKASASFLFRLISVSRESDILVNIMQNYGESLVVKVVSCIGGEAPRAGLDPFVDILLVLNKKYCDYLARWFSLIMTQESFPSALATPAQKEHFVKSVLKEKANKRKLQEIVKEFSLICRGLVNTEYGNETSVFL